MLRTVFVAGIILVGALYSWKGPFYALLFYLWIAYFRPEAWLWVDFVSIINLSFLVGLFALISTIVSGQKLRGGAGPTLLFLFLGQSLLSTLLSPAFDQAWLPWKNFAESTAISYLIVVLVTDERRFRLTALVIALSLGLEAAKQGWVQLIFNPGGQNNNEIPMLGDNNGVAVGMLMLVPMLLAVARTAKSSTERNLHRFLAIGVLYRAVVTYSRGGFLACAALGVHYLARSKRRIAAIAAVGLIVALIAPVLPPQFWNRMATIQTASEDPDSADQSIQGRLHFWNVAMVMAQDRPFIGVGVFAYNAVYDRYDFLDGEFGSRRSVHSMWFGLLSEVGYPGTILFLLLLSFGFRACWRARRLAKRQPALQTFAIYASAIEAGLLVAAVGGSFVIFQYCELMWHWLALSIALDQLVSAREAELAAAGAPIMTLAAAPFMVPSAVRSSLPSYTARTT
jgi:probable O-glycosylation ligase (exosortase A-associated)